jgi:hypothetical protein
VSGLSATKQNIRVDQKAHPALRPFYIASRLTSSSESGRVTRWPADQAFKRGSSFPGCHRLLSRNHERLDQGLQELFQRYAAGLSLCQESRIDFRLELCFKVIVMVVSLDSKRSGYPEGQALPIGSPVSPAEFVILMAVWRAIYKRESYTNIHR